MRSKQKNASQKGAQYKKSSTQHILNEEPQLEKIDSEEIDIPSEESPQKSEALVSPKKHVKVKSIDSMTIHSIEEVEKQQIRSGFKREQMAMLYNGRLFDPREEEDVPEPTNTVDKPVGSHKGYQKNRALLKPKQRRLSAQRKVLFKASENDNPLLQQIKLMEKYAANDEYFDVYRLKENTQFKPFEVNELKDQNLKAKLEGKYQKAIYSGENTVGVPHGFGHLYFADKGYENLEGQRSAYIGKFQNGMFVNGYLQFLDRSYYVGDFNPLNNKFHGPGRFTQFDGVFYQGNYSHGSKHGYGEEHSINGCVYTGNYLHDQRHGYGKITYQLNKKNRGKKFYQGEWKYDKPHGRGRELFKTANKDRLYDGQFESGYRHGYGILTDNYIDIELEKLASNGRDQLKSHLAQLAIDIPRHYSYKGQWRKNNKQGFGIENYDIDDLRDRFEDIMNYRLEYGFQEDDNLNYYSQMDFYETKYIGFFSNNLKSGEGCMELRDEELNLVGWYIGRYENGVRHGLGQDVFIESDEEEKYRIVPKIYNRGYLVRNYHQNYDSEIVVSDILSHLEFFGFMGLIDQQDEIIEESLPQASNELNRRLNLQIFDKEFPEDKKSIYSQREKSNIPTELIELYHGLAWKPIISHLFLNDFNSILEYDTSMKVLDFNSNLSSLIAIISTNPEIMKSYFPQTQMYYSEEDQKKGLKKVEQTIYDPEEPVNPQFTEQLLYYEGFVKLYDEGYPKTLYVNSYIPYDKMRRKFFFINTHGHESWILLLVKALAKVMGSYDKLSELTLEELSRILFGSQPINIDNNAFDKIYAQKKGELKAFDERSKQEKDQLKFYLEVSNALKSKNFIILAKRNANKDSADMPNYVNSKMIKQINRCYFTNYHYLIRDIIADEGPNSTLELVSKFSSGLLQQTIQTTIQQFLYLFDQPMIIMNPIQNHTTVYQTCFTPILSKKFYIFILQFEVAFAETLVQINIGVSGKKKSTKINALPIQYMVGKQYKHQNMYVGGMGQQNLKNISNTHSLSVGSYQVLVELELPDDDLVSKEIKFIVSMVSSENYVMLSGKYHESLAIEDPKVTEFYKQMYNSMALQNEERQYFGLYGKITTTAAQPNQNIGLGKILVSEAPADKEDIDQVHNWEDESNASSLDSIGGQMYKKLKVNNPIKDKTESEGQSKKLSQIFMVQHYNDQHKAFVQYIKNDSETQMCFAKTQISYMNMLQMGDQPELDSTYETLLIENRQKGTDQQMAALLHIKQDMRDISKFNYLVYDEITKNEQNYTLNFKIMPGQSCTLILREIRGGNLEKLKKFRKKAKFNMTIEKTHIRVVHCQQNIINI